MELARTIALILLICYMVAYIIATLRWLIESLISIYEMRMVYKELVKSQMEISDKLDYALSNTNDDDNDISNKTDEQLIQEWNNLWGGEPPCELDIKAIREEEREEKQNEE